MDETSVTCTSPPSTKAIVADEGFCKKVAALLLCDPAPIHDAFVGEPVEEVLEMVRWAPLPRGRRRIRRGTGADLLGEEEGEGGVER